jgi:hypothetical protein
MKINALSFYIKRLPTLGHYQVTSRSKTSIQLNTVYQHISHYIIILIHM